MNTFCRICAFVFVLPLFGCGSVYEVRTDTNNAAFKTLDEASFLKTDCKPGTAVAGEENRSIEEYGDFTIGYVEVDDQGWFYDSDAKQMKAILKRMRDELGNEAFSDAQFTTLVFVHGWHHNAHDNDCNVNEFRIMAQRTIKALKDEDKTNKKHRLFGIYVGWRGESIDIPGLRYSTIIGRRVTAEHVAKGSVRQLFAELAKLQYQERSRNKRDPKGRMRTIVVGHSFGGLIAFNATSQALLNDLVMGEPSLRDPAHPELGCIPQGKLDQHWTWPDQVALINPAFEASRFEPFNSASQETSGCKYARRAPKLLIVTADNDSATGDFFPILRWGSTAFESYNTSDQERHDAESFANHHAPGFVDRYVTHRLCLIDNQPMLNAVDETKDPFNPVWVVRVTPDILDNHDGFLFSRHRKQVTPLPHLLNWMLDVYVNRGCVAGVMDASCAVKPRKQCPEFSE